MFNLLDYTDVGSMCDDLAPVLRIVGIVVLFIEIAVPIILIVIGMLDMAKAVTEKDEGTIKKAQNLLVKRAIAAVIVFLVTFIVSLLMGVVASDDYKDCMPCVRNPFGGECNAKMKGVEGL